MDRYMLTTIVVLAVLGVAAEAAIAVLSLTAGSACLEFAMAMVLFVAILVGSYLFVIRPTTPQGRHDEGDTE